MSKLLVREFVDFFKYEVVHGNEESLNREITVAETNRAGLELAGFLDYSQHKRIVIFGDKEIEYIKTMNEEQQRRSFEFITAEDTPLLIISKSHECPWILAEIAYRKNFPILRSSYATSRLIVNITTYLDEKLAKVQSLHGGLLSIYGKGVLIRGESGTGKSEIALDLIRRGHQLISDDLVDCYLVHNSIVGRAPKILEGFLELRGVGVVNIPKIYGTNSTLNKKTVDFVVELKYWDNAVEYDRVGIEDTKYESILGVEIPKIVVPIRGGRSMATIIESAVTNIVLKEDGYDSAKDFEYRVLEYIDTQKEAK